MQRTIAIKSAARREGIGKPGMSDREAVASVRTAKTLTSECRRYECMISPYDRRDCGIKIAVTLTRILMFMTDTQLYKVIFVSRPSSLLPPRELSLSNCNNRLSPKMKSMEE